MNFKRMIKIGIFWMKFLDYTTQKEKMGNILCEVWMIIVSNVEKTIALY